jgi:hypothetical protein
MRASPPGNNFRRRGSLGPRQNLRLRQSVSALPMSGKFARGRCPLYQAGAHSCFCVALCAEFVQARHDLPIPCGFGWRSALALHYRLPPLTLSSRASVNRALRGEREPGTPAFLHRRYWPQEFLQLFSEVDFARGTASPEPGALALHSCPHHTVLGEAAL